MKCSNCSADASFVVADPGVSEVYYCVPCLPKFLRPRADAGQLDLPKVESTTPTQTKKKAATKASEPAEETASEATDENPTA